MPGATREQLDVWISATAPRALAYASSLLRDRDRAEDVVQDCYCRLLAKADRYDLLNDGMKLLMTAVTNACINLKTRRRSFWSLSAQGPEGEPIDVPERNVHAPADMAIAQEMQTVIAEGLAQLPVLQRAALELKSLGYTQQEVAEMMDITPTHAGVLIHRARLTMEKFLDLREATTND